MPASPRGNRPAWDYSWDAIRVLAGNRSDEDYHPITAILRVASHLGLHKPSLAMGTQPDETEAPVVRLAINQNEIRPDMPVAVVRPLASECTIEISPG